jgi:hypothetical protein
MMIRIPASAIGNRTLFFLEDMGMQKGAVVSRTHNHRGRGRAIAQAVLLPRGEHFPHEDAALLMLAHHAEYPAGLGDAGGFEGGKEKLLLLAMVALVAEDHDELQHLAEMLRIDLLTVGKPLA